MIAAIYDIHGNLPALEAVLDDITRAGVEFVVVGGDVVPGPMPGEALAALRDLGIPAAFLRGNGEREVLAILEGHEPVSLPEPVREVVRWNARQLAPGDRRWLSHWASTLRLHLPRLGEVLFCHATPRNDTDIFTAETPEDRLRPLFDEGHANLVVCGHTHMPFDRQVGATRVVNAGSVGMPFGEPGADWLLLGDEIELKHTTYDLARAAERIRATSYPMADEFAAKHVLQPPSARQMVETFGRAELR